MSDGATGSTKGRWKKKKTKYTYIQSHSHIRAYGQRATRITLTSRRLPKWKAENACTVLSPTSKTERKEHEEKVVKHVLQYKMLSPSKRLESLTLIHMSPSFSFHRLISILFLATSGGSYFFFFFFFFALVTFEFWLCICIWICYCRFHGKSVDNFFFLFNSFVFGIHSFYPSAWPERSIKTHVIPMFC